MSVERAIYIVAGIDPKTERRWTTYGLSMLTFSVAVSSLANPGL